MGHDYLTTRFQDLPLLLRAILRECLPGRRVYVPKRAQLPREAAFVARYLRMRFVEGGKHAQVMRRLARELHTTPEAVERRLNRYLQRLRRDLQ